MYGCPLERKWVLNGSDVCSGAVMYHACLVRRLILPLEGMAMRGPEADQQSELGG